MGSVFEAPTGVSGSEERVILVANVTSSTGEQQSQ